MSEVKKVIIIGGVAGGASAAARLRRLDENVQIIMFERGDYISFANCGLPYHIAEQIKDRDRLLVQTPEAMNQRFNIDVRIRSEVVSIDRDNKQVRVRNINEDKEYTESYDKLVLTPGAGPFVPPMTGSDLQGVHTLRTINDMDAIKSVVDQGKCKRAVVVGGGYIGLEMAEALIDRGVDTSLIEIAPQVMGTVDQEMAVALHTELKLHGVKLYLGNSISEIVKKDDDLELILSEGEKLNAQLVIMAIGVKPETKLAVNAGLEIGQRGGIVVSDTMQTSDPDIYAAGDAVEVVDFIGGFKTVIPLAGPANRQGRIAADNICGRNSVYKHTQGTAICKVFNLAAAVTGMNERNLKRNNINYEKIYVHPSSHAGYYPGASQMSIKMLFDPKDGKILGAQAIGADGVDKRIDVISVAMRAGFTVFDLQDIELCYAPPFGSAKDPVNYAGFVAANIIKGDTKICHADEIANPKPNQFLIDVREKSEFTFGTIPGSVNIAVGDLRDRLNDIPKDKELLVFCQVGLRGYIAARLLEQHGYNVRNLTGGYKTYCAVNGVHPEVVNLDKDVTSDSGEQRKKAPEPKDIKVIRQIDACGLQCPGPIMQLKKAVDEIQTGQAVEISTSDPGFAGDIKGWCSSTGNQLSDLKSDSGKYIATIVKGSNAPVQTATNATKSKTIVVFNEDFDKAMATFIIANGAAAMGSEVTLFFTFWGINLLRRNNSVNVNKTFIEKMFGFMMPCGSNKVKLSKMNMCGIGTSMIKGIMKSKNVTPLESLIAQAQASGVKMVACSMSMGLMGIKKEELIEGVEEGGVAMYLERAENANVNLFI